MGGTEVVEVARTTQRFDYTKPVGRIRGRPGFRPGHETKYPARVRVGTLMAAAAAAWGLSLVGAGAQGGIPQKLLHQQPAIGYQPLGLTATIEAANRALERSAPYDVQRGYLAAALSALDVPVESQLLIFSKTGVSQALTSPQNPRAFYFNDSVVVGHVPGAAFIEVATLAPGGGAHFYTLPQDRATAARLAPNDECLRCHVSANTLEVPGFIARSMYVDRDGRIHPQLGSHLVDHRRDYAERWGGWFVTGAPDTLRHLGNTIVGSSGEAPPASASEVPTLEGRAPVERYLSPYSDVTALAVFDHQMHAMNLLTRLGWATRVAAASAAPDFGAGPLRDLLHEAADYLLLAEEAPLDGPIDGGSGFAEVFTARGPRDGRGRSLRDFDRRSKLFRYPASYMVYSPAFDALPEPARRMLMERMRTVLEGHDPHPRYQRLAAADRETALEILRETKADWPR